MDDTQRIVKCGNLSLHTNGGFFKKRWHSKYLVLYDGSKSGIKRLELFDSEIKFKKQQPAKIIALVDCVRVVTCQRQKTTYTFEVRTNDQFYLLAAQSFQDMNDWVNCLRLVAFGQSSSSSQPTIVQQQHQLQQRQLAEAASKLRSGNGQGAIKDVLLDKGISGSTSAKALTDVSRSITDLNQQHLLSTAIASSRNSLQQPKDPHHGSVQQLVTASQAAAAAASALAKARQRQPSLLGSCKPQPPTDSPFIQATTLASGQSFANKDAKTLLASMIGQVDTMTPAVRGQLIPHKVEGGKVAPIAQQQPVLSKQQQVKGSIPATLDEEEENMLYCSIEDNPSEHNYRVKVIETDLSLRCQLKCYQLTASSTISQQYEELGQFGRNRDPVVEPVQPPVTFYQLIIGPQELTLLNDYATATSPRQQQGLWSWPYQCIRRYGFDKDNCFMFEAGRKCTSGPGQFIVQTPKAYNIYQDVVKFVNELRSLTGPNSQHTDDHQLINDKLKLDDSKRGPSVTQIPVTWAPSGATTISVDVAVSRQQFFDSLRQLDTSPKSQSSLRGHPSEVCSSSSSSTSSSASPSASTSSGSRISSTESTLSSTTTKNSNSTSQQTNGQACTKPKQEQVAAKMLSKSMQKLDSAVTPEETDESGYEQGDDAEVSGEFRSKSNVLNVTRKRQANDSMSSASSTSSGGGSPGQTVSRRSGGTTGGNLSGLNSQGPSKRPAINTSSMSAEIHQKGVATKDNEPQQQKEALHGLLSASRRAVQDDFETNLIRDVYSEITKLHAKFAVTSGSAEDIVGSCGNSSSDNASSGGGLTLDDMDDCVDDSVHDANKEPVYSNLKTTGPSSSVVSRAKNRFEPDNIDNNTRGKPLSSLSTSSMNNKNNNQPTSAYTQGPFMVGLDRLNMHHPHKTNNSYQPIADNYDNYLSSAGRCGPMYPSILNPIPECAELNPPRNTVGLRSQLIGRTKSSGHLARGNETSYNKDDWDCENIQLSDGKQQQVTPSNPLKSKLPTNHYVINDVQYAKVSRNLSSKFDQCI